MKTNLLFAYSNNIICEKVGSTTINVFPSEDMEKLPFFLGKHYRKFDVHSSETHCLDFYHWHRIFKKGFFP